MLGAAEGELGIGVLWKRASQLLAVWEAVGNGKS